MANSTHDLVSVGSVRLALHSLAQVRKELADKVATGGFDHDDEELDYQADKVERLILAINEFVSLYEQMSEGHPNEPSVEEILKQYV